MLFNRTKQKTFFTKQQLLGRVDHRIPQHFPVGERHKELWGATPRSNIQQGSSSHMQSHSIEQEGSWL